MRLQHVSETHSYGEGFNGRLAKYRALMIRELHVRGGTLLDLGAGEGLLTKLIARDFDCIEVVEASPLYMEKAKSALEGYPAVFHNKLIEDFDSSSEFDIVLASGVLEHVNEPQRILGKIKKWLKKDGKFIGLVPNAKAFHRRIGLQMGLINDLHELGPQDLKVGHRRYYDLSMLRDEASNAGFSVVRSGGIFFKILPNAQMEPLSEEYCDALFSIGRDFPDLCAEIFIVCKKCTNDF
jgi:SAM-dependent methyltransferase